MASLIKLLARRHFYPNLVRTGISKSIANFSKHQFLILNYHGVIDKVDFNYSINHMDAEQFEHQIKFLSKNFNILSQDEFLYHYLNNKTSNKKSILLTFDDGYENNFKFAFPLLKKYNTPATIFLISSLIDSKNPTWYDLIDNTSSLFNNEKHRDKIGKLCTELGINSQKEILHNSLKKYLKTQSTHKKNEILEKYLSIIGDKSMDNIDEKYWKILSSDQIIKMQQSGIISFGSHTVTHPNLDQINKDDVELELKDSKSKIENILGKKIKTIAFPDGAYNENVKIMSKEAGYTNLFAVNYRCESDKNDNSILNRYSISNTTTAESVITNICLAFQKQGF